MKQGWIKIDDKVRWQLVISQPAYLNDDKVVVNVLVGDMGCTALNTDHRKWRWSFSRLKKNIMAKYFQAQGQDHSNNLMYLWQMHTFF